MSNIYTLLAALLIVIASPVYAMGGIKINPDSPLLTDSPMIAKIYEQSCIAGTNENQFSEQFPMFMQDQIADKFQRIYSPQKFIMWNNTLFFVSAGYDLGRTLALTNINGVDTDDMCKQYSINFAASLVNNPMNWDRKITQPKATPFSFEVEILFDNPLNDLLAPKETGQLNVTPKLAKENGCRYAYTVAYWHPRIDVSPLDVTVDMMENMLWHDYDHDSIRAAYPFILMGAKQGYYLYQNHQDIKVCYE